MSKARLFVVGGLGAGMLLLLDLAYGAGKLEGKGYAKASLSAHADPSPVEADGEESDDAPESDQEDGE